MNVEASAAGEGETDALASVSASLQTAGRHRGDTYDGAMLEVAAELVAAAAHAARWHERVAPDYDITEAVDAQKRFSSHWYAMDAARATRDDLERVMQHAQALAEIWATVVMRVQRDRKVSDPFDTVAVLLQPREAASQAVEWRLAERRVDRAVELAQGLSYDERAEIIDALEELRQLLTLVAKFGLKRSTGGYVPQTIEAFRRKAEPLWRRGDEPAKAAMDRAVRGLRADVVALTRAWREEAGLVAADPSEPDAVRRRGQEAAAALAALQDKISTDEVRHLAVEAREAAQQALELQQRTAGVQSQGVLIDGFATYGKAEEAIANRFRWAALALSGAGVLAAGLIGFLAHISTAAELAKLAWTLPLGGLAAYCGRESGRHRRAADWAAVLDVQLRAIDHYCASLGADGPAAATLRASFGQHVFLAKLPTDGTSDGDARAAVELLQALRSLTEAGTGTPVPKFTPPQ